MGGDREEEIIHGESRGEPETGGTQGEGTEGERSRRRRRRRSNTEKMKRDERKDG